MKRSGGWRRKNRSDVGESFTGTEDQWYKNNKARIESLYQQVETAVNRVKTQGFWIAASRTAWGIRVKFFSPLGYPRRSVAVEPNYRDGLTVRFSDSHGEVHVGRASDRTKEKQLSLGRMTERRIRSWIKWVATGRRPFWSL